VSLALTSRRAALLPGRWLQNELWRRAKAVPSLDLRFAENKSLVDATTGANLVTFTRASSGTYVGSDGLIKTAVTNLLLQSEDFSTTWASAYYSISTDATVAPDGKTTADKPIRDTTSANTSVAQNASVVVSTAYNFSCFAKAAEWSKIGLREGAVTGNYVTFNLATGAVISSSGATGTITALANGWYRISMQMTTGAAQTSYGMRIIPLPNDYTSGTPSYAFAGDDTSGIYLWGAQLEQSSTVGEYIPTGATINSAPRFDHDPTTGESLGLLVEESRTNLLLQSEDFSTTWIPTRASVSTNAVAAPDGLITADKLVEDNTPTNTHTIGVNSGMVAGTTYTYSVFAKAAERSWLVLSPGSTWGYGWFNVSTGSLGTLVDGGSGATAKIEAYPNGWYRCSITATAVDNRGLFILLAAVNGGVSYSGDGTSGIYIWGAQLEAGAFPTSYIPTTTTAVTRSADVASISGSNFSSWYRQDEGSAFADFSLPTTAGNTAIFSLSQASAPTANRHSIRQGNSIITSSGTQVANFINQTTAANARSRIAYGYKVDDFFQVLNNGTTAADTSGAVPLSIDQLNIGKVEGTSIYSNGPIRRLTYWPARLPNSTLQTITQP
jgi:hypothetical protein